MESFYFFNRWSSNHFSSDDFFVVERFSSHGCKCLSFNL